MQRHSDVVHELTHNRRQTDPDERKALAALRDGDLTETVGWYKSRGRIRAIPNRHEALRGAVDAWSADVAAGHETALLAWRRAHVEQLNALARDWMAVTGRFSGPELTVPDGGAYRAGDQVIILAPDHQAALVTSQRGTVEAVDSTNGSLQVGLDDGRKATLAGGQLGSDRLGYGYATTVHRSQGATVDRAHFLADGGGRELAYVAMSRARERSTAWVVADDIEQAAEDLKRDWSLRRTPVWAIDSGLPDPAACIGDDVHRLSARQQDGLVAVAHARHRVRGNAGAGALQRDRPSEASAELARQVRAAQVAAVRSSRYLASVRDHLDGGRVQDRQRSGAHEAAATPEQAVEGPAL